MLLHCSACQTLIVTQPVPPAFSLVVECPYCHQLERISREVERAWDQAPEPRAAEEIWNRRYPVKQVDQKDVRIDMPQGWRP